MIIVCLDQCAISNLALNADKNPVLRELRDLLKRGARDMRLICPLAVETILETTGCGLAERRLIYELQCELAAARLSGLVWTFKSMWRLINEETLALARTLSPPSAFQIGQWLSPDNDHVAKKTWEDIIASKETMTQRAYSIPLQQVEGDPLFNKIRDGILLDHARHIYRQLERLLNDLSPDSENYLGYGLACHLQKAEITNQELQKLIADVLRRKWEIIPVIFIYAHLSAQVEVEFRRRGSPKVYNPNDEFDVPRMAVGLAASDMIITDKGMTHLCRSVGPRFRSDTAVFGVNKPEEAIAFLQSHGVT